MGFGSPLHIEGCLDSAPDEMKDSRDPPRRASPSLASRVRIGCGVGSVCGAGGGEEGERKLGFTSETSLFPI